MKNKKIFWSSSLVQSVERRTVNPYVAGSSPAGGAKKNSQGSLMVAFFIFTLRIFTIFLLKFLMKFI